MEANNLLHSEHIQQSALIGFTIVFTVHFLITSFLLYLDNILGNFFSLDSVFQSFASGYFSCKAGLAVCKTSCLVRSMLVNLKQGKEPPKNDTQPKS